jgi:hypothetical protein
MIDELNVSTLLRKKASGIGHDFPISDYEVKHPLLRILNRCFSTASLFSHLSTHASNN